MRFLYACDVHGDEFKYDQIYARIEKENIKYIVFGGDILPKHTDDRKIEQINFINNYLDSYFTKLEEKEIQIILILGNDDLESVEENFNEIVEKHKNVHNINKKRFDVDDVSFVGLSDILDHPFPRKDRILIEKDLEMQPQRKDYVMINKGTQKLTIEEWKKYRKTKLDYMEDVLESLPKVEEGRKAIYIFHNPPYGIDLDCCKDGSIVGSKAILNFLQNSNMYASFHGHIHESPRMTMYWCKNINNGVAIQPGQTEYSKKGFLFVEADTNKDEFTYIIKQKGMMTCMTKQFGTPDTKLFFQKFEY